MKRILSLILTAALLLSLCACDGSGRYKVVETIGEQQYSIGFRNGDSTYHYIYAALKELNKNGTIDRLSREWFGNDGAVSFPGGKSNLSDFGYIAPRTFIIGADLDSFPMCYFDGSNFNGFDVELAREVCSLLGWTLKIQPIHSDDAYVELNSGNIDCAWGGVVLDTKSADYTILTTYMTTDLVIAAKSSTSSSLKGKSMFMGSAQHYLDVMSENESVSKKLGQITRVQGGTVDYFNCLNNGECDFILTTSSAVYYYNNNW